MRRLWPAGLGLAAAIALTIWVQPGSKLARIGNLDLEGSVFRDTYLVLHRSESDRCFVVNRRDATIRRADQTQPGRKWRCYRLEPNAEGALPAWLVQSKREGKGTAFFVPSSQVSDWSFPFFYEVARAGAGGDELPLVEWTQLYISRVYQGLYLRVDLPFDRRKKDGGTGVLRELLSITGDSVSVVDTRFDDAPGVYAAAVATGAFPTLRPPKAQVAWLAEHAPTRGTTFLMSNAGDSEVSLLPLPVWLPELFRVRYGRNPAAFRDRRFDRLTEGAWRREGMKSAEWTSDPKIREGFKFYAKALRRALEIDSLARGVAVSSDLWSSRQAAARSVDFVKGGL